MPKTIHKTAGGVYETEHSTVKLNFLDCQCQCCGDKQKYLPDQSHFSHPQFYTNLMNMLIKPHYALDCTCQCGSNQKQITGFSTDTGVLRFDQGNQLRTTCSSQKEHEKKTN